MVNKSGIDFGNYVEGTTSCLSDDLSCSARGDILFSDIY